MRYAQSEQRQSTIILPLRVMNARQDTMTRTRTGHVCKTQIVTDLGAIGPNVRQHVAQELSIEHSFRRPPKVAMVKHVRTYMVQLIIKTVIWPHVPRRATKMPVHLVTLSVKVILVARDLRALALIQVINF